jgi:cytochrome P450
VAFGPAEIEEVLTERAVDFRKSFGTRMLIPLLGNGLLTAEGDEWLRHRRLASPAFHRERVAGYGRTMVREATDATDAWHDGDRIDVHDELTALTLRIVARTLFDADVTARIQEVSRLGTEIQDFYFGRFASLRFLIPTWLPTPGNRRLGALTRSSTTSSASVDRARTGATCSRRCSWRATSRAPACPNARSATR